VVALHSAATLNATTNDFRFIAYPPASVPDFVTV
jgi:hypothetical protein